MEQSKKAQDLFGELNKNQPIIRPSAQNKRDADFAKFYSQTALQIQHHSTTYHIPLQKPAPAGTHARSSFGSFAPPAPPAHRWATAKIWARHQIHKCAWVDVHDAQDQLLGYNPGNPWKLQKNDIRIFVQNLIPTNFHKTRCFLLQGWVWKRFLWEFFKKVETAIPCYIFLLQWDPGQQKLKSLHASWTHRKHRIIFRHLGPQCMAALKQGPKLRSGLGGARHIKPQFGSCEFNSTKASEKYRFCWGLGWLVYPTAISSYARGLPIFSPANLLLPSLEALRNSLIENLTV